jgi:AGZA family xanthine/uracil permease-like MFS transporter
MTSGPVLVSLGGIGFGVLGYVLVLAARGRIRALHPLMWVVTALFVLYFASDWLSAHVF